MVEKLVTNHPPLQVCYPGHHPHLWQANGECSTTYFVECSACGVRTRRCGDAETASHAWAHREVTPITSRAVA